MLFSKIPFHRNSHNSIDAARITGSQLLGAALIISPLIIYPSFSYDHPELVFVLVVLAVAFILLSFSLIKNNSFKLRRDPLLVAAGLFFMVNLASFLKNGNLKLSVHDLSIRLSPLFVYFFITNFLDRRFLKRYLFVLLIVGAISSIYGILQVAGFDPVYKNPENLAVSILGNTGYAGCFCAMIIPLAFCMSTGLKNYLAILCLLASCIHLLFTESRAGLVGAFTGLIFSSFFLVCYDKKKLKIILLFFLLAVCALFFKRDVIERFSPGQTFKVRLAIWDACLELFKTKPVLGIAVGSFPESFVPFRRQEEIILSKGQQVNNAHSIFVQVLTDSGIAGFISLLFIIYVAYRRILFFIKTSPEKEKIIGLTGGGLAFLVSGFFYSLDQSITLFLYFWLMLALIETLGNNYTRFKTRRVTLLTIAGFFLVSLGISLLVLMEYEHTASDYYYNKALASRETGEDLLNESLKYNKYNPLARYQVGILLEKKGDFKKALEHYDFTLNYINKNHIDTMINKAIAYAQLRNDFDTAKDQLMKAQKLAPTYYLVFYNFGILHAKFERYQQALEYFLEAWRLNNDFTPSLFYLGTVRYFLGDTDGAVLYFKMAARKGFEIKSRLMALLNDPGKVQDILKKVDESRDK